VRNLALQKVVEFADPGIAQMQCRELIQRGPTDALLGVQPDQQCRLIRATQLRSMCPTRMSPAIAAP
jgi:hypothetical protein